MLDLDHVWNAELLRQSDQLIAMNWQLNPRYKSSTLEHITYSVGLVLEPRGGLNRYSWARRDSECHNGLSRRKL